MVTRSAPRAAGRDLVRVPMSSPPGDATSAAFPASADPRFATNARPSVAAPTRFVPNAGPVVLYPVPLVVTPGTQSKVVLRGLRLDGVKEVTASDPAAKVKFVAARKANVANNHPKERLSRELGADDPRVHRASGCTNCSQPAYRTRALSRANPARPYIDRLIDVSRFTAPSTGPFDSGPMTPARTAA